VTCNDACGETIAHNKNTPHSVLQIPHDTCHKTSYIAGMPHLGIRGLSEKWLTRQCGDLHWHCLAESTESGSSDFRDARGRKVYAAFKAVRLTDAALTHFELDSQFEIETRLRQLTRTVYESEHRLICGGVQRAIITMISVFLRRNIPGDNRSMERTEVNRIYHDDSQRSQHTSPFMLAARAVRLRESWTYDRWRYRDRQELGHFQYACCPSTDFNNAELLYFPVFQEVVDRAEWLWMNRWNVATVSRDIIYHGNVNTYDDLTVTLCGKTSLANIVYHWCDIKHSSDQKVVADVFSIRHFYD
jgi:probable biosynthetic protein (TIGR04099 family)